MARGTIGSEAELGVRDDYKPLPEGSFLDLNGTAVGDIQRLGKFLREEFAEGGPIKKHAIDEAIERLRELKDMRYYKAIVDELDEDTRVEAARRAQKRGVIRRLQPSEKKLPDDMTELFRKVFASSGWVK